MYMLKAHFEINLFAYYLPGHSNGLKPIDSAEVLITVPYDCFR